MAPFYVNEVNNKGWKKFNPERRPLDINPIANAIFMLTFGDKTEVLDLSDVIPLAVQWDVNNHYLYKWELRELDSPLTFPKTIENYEKLLPFWIDPYFFVPIVPDDNEHSAQIAVYPESFFKWVEMVASNYPRDVNPLDFGRIHVFQRGDNVCLRASYLIGQNYLILYAKTDGEDFKKRADFLPKAPYISFEIHDISDSKVLRGLGYERY